MPEPQVVLEGSAEVCSSPRDAVELLEALLHRMHAVAGDWTLEVFASDAHVRKWKLVQHGGRDELARFDEPPLRPRGC